MYEYLVIDFEFTVFTSYGRPRFFFPEIIEIGAALLRPPYDQTEHHYQSFVKPRSYPRLTQECKNITLITQEDVDNGLDLAEVLETLRVSYVPGKTVFASWGEADRSTLMLNCHRYGLKYPFVYDDYVDLATAYRDFYQTGYRRSVKDALEERQIVPQGIPHSALDDAVNEAMILARMLKDGWAYNGPVHAAREQV